VNVKYFLNCCTLQMRTHHYLALPWPLTKRRGYIYCHNLLKWGWHTGCPRTNVPDFGRVFLMLKYTDITQNTYNQSWTVTEIMAREKWGLLAVPNTATCTADTSRDSANVLDSGMQFSLCLRDALRSQPCYVTARLSHYSACNPKDNYDTSASVFVVQFNGFMSLTS